MIDKAKIELLFKKWINKLRLTPEWDIRLEWIEDPNWGKTGDFKVDCTDRKGIILLNGVEPKQENLEEVLVHELLHLKLYPLDQFAEGMIKAHYTPGTAENRFVYHQFFGSLEQTVEELTKCFLLDGGENRDLSFGRCRSQKSFQQLYDELEDLT